MSERMIAEYDAAGELVYRPATPEEVADLDAVAAAASAGEQAEANAATIRERLETSIGQLRAGSDAIQAGTLFQGLTNQERAFLRLLARTSLGLARLELRALDETE